MIVIPHKTATHNNYSHLPTLADNLSPIGRETPRVDGSVSLVDRKFFCAYTYKKYIIAFIKDFINMSK